MRLALAVLLLSLPIAVFSADAREEQHPGYGVVESVVAMRHAPRKAEESASAGASAPSRTRYTYRLKVRMEDGSLQYRERKADQFAVGDRVLLTNAGDVLPD